MVLLTMPGNVSCVGSVYHCLYIQSPSLNPVGHILNWGKVLSCTVLYSLGHVLVSCSAFCQHNKYCRESRMWVAKFAILEMLNTKLQFGFSFRMEYMINSGLVRIGAIHKWIPNLN